MKHLARSLSGTVQLRLGRATTKAQLGFCT